MNVDALRIGMKVKHPAYGLGTVKAVAEHTADILFEDGRRTISPEGSALSPAEPMIETKGLDTPLDDFIERVVSSVAEKLGLERPDTEAVEMAGKWKDGMLVLRPSDPSLQSKEVPLEVFFHKIVMMRNQLRVLEQKVNAHEGLSDVEKVEMQQYITRCYGSMTTFNLLFRSRDDQFGG
jgi:hypothetical protein